MNYQLKLPFELEVLIPFIKDMEEHLSFHYRDIVADAGYESEENYLFLEGNGQTAYIKPNIFKSRISERIFEKFSRLFGKKKNSIDTLGNISYNPYKNDRFLKR